MSEEKRLIQNNNVSDIDGFGFDLGDGESAVAWLKLDGVTEPHMLEICGQKSVTTALARLNGGDILIGQNACRALDPVSLQLRFKSKYLSRPDYARGCITVFARAVLKELIASGRLQDTDNAAFAVGCPSGWNEDQREEYRLLLEKCGFHGVCVISESRAAFLYSRESGELRVSAELLNQPTLIIDAGSSTTDFTYVKNLNERRVEAFDFGDTMLGGGLIDRGLWRRALNAHPRRDALNELLHDYPQYDARCEMEARKVKEMYFTRQKLRGADMLTRCESSVKLHCVTPPLTVDIECTDADMEAVLHEPLAELGGKCYLKAYGDALLTARDALSDAPPRVLLMTGGASRMRFMADMAQEVFPDAALVIGVEPEFAIARGLAYALRIDAHTRGFMNDVQAFIESTAVEDAVTQALPKLFAALCVPLADALCAQAAVPAFERWRHGALNTLNDMAQDVREQCAQYFQSDALKALIAPVLKDWLKDFMPTLEALTDPICDRFTLPRTALRVSAELNLSPDSVGLDTGNLVDLNVMRLMIDVTLSALFAALMGGSGIALVSGGLPGLIVGAFIGLAVGVLGTRAAEALVRRAFIALPVRRLFTARRYAQSLARKRDDISASLYAQFIKETDARSPAVRSMIERISQGIRNQLHEALREAVLLIH